MAFLCDIGANIVTGILEYLWTPVERQIGYLVHYERNLKSLRERARDLEAVKNDVHKNVCAAQDKGEEIKDEVVNWYVKAIQVELDVEFLDAESSKVQGCWHARFFCCGPRHRLSRLAKKNICIIGEHLQKCKFDCVSLPARTPGVVAIPTPSFVPLESWNVMINQIMEVLNDDANEVNIIGVYGAGGIGKTMLMKLLVKQAKMSNVFDDVAIAPVSRTPNLKEIQSAIADLIGLKIEEDSLIGRAARLSQRLKQKGKVLVILDDLWEFLQLEEIGIPYGNEHKGCKVVVTSRKLEVCNNMDIRKTFLIEKLSAQDSWNLFMSKAEDLVVAEELREIARKIVLKCDGIPNSIVTVARALRNKTVAEWNDAVRRLEEPTKLKIKDVGERVVSILKFSYDQIETEAAKLCLFYCCMFPEYYNVSMEEVVVYGLVDALFPNVCTLGEVWTKMVSVLDYLKSSNFLLEGDKEGCFKVHDDTRDVVTALGSKSGYNMMTKASSKLKSWPEASESCKRISLMDNEIAKLPDWPQCPELLILLLQNNAVEEIPERFFQHMKALRYLDISYTFISSLPGSLQHLQDLRSLRLENTHLRDATQLKRLRKLEVLSLKGSCLEQLPEGLEEMTNLKLLDLSNNPYLRSFPLNVISKLAQLEQLYIANSFGGWEIEGTGNQGQVGFNEVTSLACLTVLHIWIKDTKVLSKNFYGPWGKLTKFCICVHNDYWDMPSARSMNLKNLSYPVADWVKVLLEKTENLSLTHARDFEDIVRHDLQDLNGLRSLHIRACSIGRILQCSLFPKVKNLEDLHVEYCYSMKEVFSLDEIEYEEYEVFALRELVLVGLPKMTNIWKGNLSKARVEKLKSIKVRECGRLSNLFTISLAQKLCQLENLAVISCDYMEEIIPNKFAKMESMIFQNLLTLTISKCQKMSCILPLSVARGLKQLQELTVISCSMVEIVANGEEANETDDRDMLPRLKILALENMPNLGTFCNGVSYFKWPSLQELQVRNCPDLKKLPLALHSSPKLRKLTGQSTWFEKLKWVDQGLKMRLQRLLVEED